MRKELFQPTDEGEARLLILIGTFSEGERCLEGRTKLAKLDFLLRYPTFLRRALNVRKASKKALATAPDTPDIESGMIRYRYGPWDPSYFALLGRLIGKRLIDPVPFSRGIGYKITDAGTTAVDRLVEAPEWDAIRSRAEVILKNFNLSGSGLTKFIYRNFPEVAGANWGEKL